MWRIQLAILSVLLAVASSRAQQAAKPADAQDKYVPSFTFDVASVRESPQADAYRVGGPNPTHNSSVNLTNMSVPNLMGLAFGVDYAQIVGLPAWTLRVMFNVQAKADASVDEQLAKLPDREAWVEKQHMFQALLADRFSLRAHWETKPSPIYELVVAKNGPKMKPGGSTQLLEDERGWLGNGNVPQIYQRGNGVKGYEYIGHNCTIASLASSLTAQMGVPVVDKTNLTGTYDFTLQYHGTVPEDANDDPNVWPALNVAVPDQLGLRMVPAKGQRDFLVIDHIEKPSAN